MNNWYLSADKSKYSIKQLNLMKELDKNEIELNRAKRKHYVLTAIIWGKTQGRHEYIKDEILYHKKVQKP